jgi:hypothetical protein
MQEENVDPVISRTIIASSDEFNSHVVNKIVNYQPNTTLLPPAKSKKRGRPPKSTIKSKLDIAIGKIIKKGKKEKAQKKI